ncbi:MAG: NUDIX hydrolase [Patescibacteria group bacterium]|nr:NUDIX hydrolase [Patescibacteria group bacterium]MBU2509591.1 NUDIX hydrolase [Patescibacteria group bacterium]
MKWRKLNSKIVYKNQWLQLREDTVIRPDGKRGIYSIVERPPVNFIIASDKKGSIFFIKEYRYPIKKTILQLPAGTTDKNKSYLASAKKELFEETGLKAKSWKKLGKFYIGPGHENICANVFLATKLDPSQRNKSTQAGDELILQVVKLSVMKIKQLINSNKIECGITLAALNLYFLKSKK